ncbi:MAG: ATP-binding protein [Promethearchaeota archaeon]
MRYKVTIDTRRCTGCSDCIKACIYGVLELIDNVAYPANPKYCKGCEECIRCCQAGAIEVTHV